MQNFVTKVLEIKPLTPNIVELSVELEEPSVINFEAGQFMQFAIGNLFRAYSIVNTPAPDSRRLTFAVKLLDDGLGSNFVRALGPGDHITMRGALGLLTIKDLDQDYCLVANGVGVAPFISKINDLLINRNYKNKLTLVFGVRSEEDIFYHAELRALADKYSNFEFMPLLSQPKRNWQGEVGRVTHFMEANYAKYASRFFYLCGSQNMVADGRKILLDNGHDHKTIKIEIFT